VRYAPVLAASLAAQTRVPTWMSSLLQGFVSEECNELVYALYHSHLVGTSGGKMNV